MESDGEAYFARFASMLVDLGGETVRKLFNERVLRKFKVQPAQMDALFKKADVKALMQSKSWLFTKEVYGQITSSWYSSRQYDLTVLILLIGVLELVDEPANGWRSYPSKSDNSDGAQLVRLRKIRNEMYGHITNTAVFRTKYNGSYETLKEVLCSLGATKAEVEQYKAKFNAREVRDLLTDQMKKDLDEVRQVSIKLEELAATQDDKFKQLIDEIKKIDYQHESFSEKVLEALQRYGSLEQKVTILLKDNARIQEQIAGAYVVKPVVDREIQPYLKTIVDVLSDKQPVFRILVKTCVRQDNQSDFHDTPLEDLAKACGLCDWNVVIDLEFETQRTVEFRNAVSKAMSAEPKVITYKDLENIVDLHTQVASNKLSLWLLANGGQDTPPCLADFAKTEHRISRLLHDLFRTMEKKPVQSFLLAMSDAFEEEVDAVSGVASVIKNALDSWEENIATAYSYQCCLIFEDFAAKWLDAIIPMQLYSTTKKRRRPEPLKAKAPVSQISAMFTSAFPSKKLDDVFFIPGSEGKCAINRREFNFFSLDMTVFHWDIGILSDATKKELIKLNFVKGGGITPEVLRLQKTDPPAYVVRKEMKDWLKTIKEELNKRDPDYPIKSKSIYNLRHAPSAGGTTCAQYFLFKLRKKFPCIQVRSYSDKLLPNLNEIYKRSKKPLFLVVEQTDFETKNAVGTLQKQLRDVWVKSLILYVEQHSGIVSTISHDYVFQLNARVFEEDVQCFEKLYVASTKWKGCGDRSVFQFGILSLLDNYSRIEKHVKDCTSEKNASDSQLRILRALCFLSKYSPTKLVKRPLILRYLDSREDHNEEALNDKLGDLSDFVVTEVDANGFFVCKIIVNCLIEPLLLRCRARLLPDGEKRTEMVDFLDDLKRLVELDLSVERSDSANLVRGIFIHRNQSEETDVLSEYGEWPSKQAKQHFANFVLDLEKECGADKVSELMSSIADLFPCTGSGAHFRALRARYLMYVLKRGEEAIQEIKKALGLQAQSIQGETVTNDPSLLVTYGQLVMKRAWDNFNGSKGVDIGMRLKEFQAAVTEAVEAYSRAQKLKVPRPGYPKGQYNSFSFIEESRARYELLNLHLNHLWNSDIREMYKNLAKNEKNSFLRKSYLKAMQALQKLDYYFETSLVYDRDRKVTESRINRVKWDLLKFVIDGKQNLSDFAHEIPVKQLFDIGWYALQRGKKSGKKIRFVDLLLCDLKLIHSWIDNRIKQGGAIHKNNYRDYIMAMICIVQHDSTLKSFNTASAIECANRWIKDFPWDFEAHFMRGSLYLVQAIDQNDEKDTELYSLAIADFDAAKKIAEKNDERRTKWARQFNIGVGESLERLLPMELSRSASKQLKDFSGCLVGKNEVSVYSHAGKHAFKARVSHHHDLSAIDLSHVRPQVKFNIVLRYAGILAEDLKFLENAT